MRAHTFSDFDEFAASVRDVDSKMMLRNPERRVWSTSAVDVDGIDVQLGRLGSGNIARGQLRPDGYMFYVPLTGGIEYVANGCVVDHDACVVMYPGCEFCISTKVAHDWGAVFIPTRFLLSQSERSELLSTDGANCRVTRPHRQAADRLRATIQEILNTATRSPRFEQTPAATSAATEVVSSVGAMTAGHLAPAARGEGRPKLPRDIVIRRCLEFLEQRSEQPPRVDQLAAAAGVSERTLRTAFKEYFGVGPKQYLQLRHLHQVHRALKAASCDEASVTQILMEHGEWAFSRFASRYRKLFGELPSESLGTKTKS